ncbi:hypothetical protein JCM9534A_42440 [Catenuloplanes indicus JCM 9534]
MLPIGIYMILFHPAGMVLTLDDHRVEAVICVSGPAESVLVAVFGLDAAGRNRSSPAAALQRALADLLDESTVTYFKIIDCDLKYC